MNNATIGDAARLVKFFDSDGDGILSYNDFIQIVLPCDDNVLRSEVQRRPYSRVGRFDSLPIDMELALIRILQFEIDFITRIESMVRDIGKEHDYSLYAAFRTIDRHNEEYINIGNLQDFMRSFGVYLVDRELFACIRRIDTDGDAKINFSEFSDFFSHQMNVDAALIPEPMLMSNRKINKKLQYSYKKKDEHRGYDFATDSKQGANIEKMLNRMYARHSLLVSPV